MRGRDILCVRHPELLALVTGGTGAIGRVVVLVAVTTATGSGRRRHGDRLGVTLHAAKLGVPKMGKAHRARTRRAVFDRDGNRHDSGLLALLNGMAIGAIGLIGWLMVTDLTSPRWLEGQATVEVPGRMAGQAGKLLMPSVRKAVDRCGRGLTPCGLVTAGAARPCRVGCRERSELENSRIAGLLTASRLLRRLYRRGDAPIRDILLLPLRLLDRRPTGGWTKRPGGVERQRGPQAKRAETAGDSGVAGYTIARVYPGGVLLVTDQTPRGDLSMDRAGMKGDRRPVGVTLGGGAGGGCGLG
jgi:hypothetical protein